MLEYFLYHQAPAVDVVGVGLQSGKIILHNLKFDEVVMSFHQDWGPVTALTFRTGNSFLSVLDKVFHFNGFRWSGDISGQFLLNKINKIINK